MYIIMYILYILLYDNNFCYKLSSYTQFELQLKVILLINAYKLNVSNSKPICINE